MKNIENLVGRMHQESGDSLLNREGWNVCVAKHKFYERLSVNLNRALGGQQSLVKIVVDGLHLLASSPTPTWPIKYFFFIVTQHTYLSFQFTYI